MLGIKRILKPICRKRGQNCSCFSFLRLRRKRNSIQPSSLKLPGIISERSSVTELNAAPSVSASGRSIRAAAENRQPASPLEEKIRTNAEQIERALLGAKMIDNEYIDSHLQRIKKKSSVISLVTLPLRKIASEIVTVVRGIAASKVKGLSYRMAVANHVAAKEATLIAPEFIRLAENRECCVPGAFLAVINYMFKKRRGNPGVLKIYK